MAKEVIVLRVDSKTIPGSLIINYLLWLTTTSPVSAPSFTTQFPGATAGEIAALQAGTTIEESYSVPFPNSLTKAQVELFLQSHASSRQAAFSAGTQPGAFFGTFFDSLTGWSS